MRKYLMKSERGGRNTVDNCAPDFTRPVASLRSLDGHGHSTKGEDGAGARADLPCFPPCARRGVDGIFRPGEAGSTVNSKMQFQDAWEHLLERKEIGQPRWNVAAMADGGR